MSDAPKAILISGDTGVGKSSTLRNMRGSEGILYLNCDGGKPLPFKTKAKQMTIDDPYEIFAFYDKVIANPGRFHTIVTDTVSFMMNRFESVHVIGSANTMTAWGEYGQFFPKLMYDYVSKYDGYSVMYGHEEGILNEETQRMQYSVPVKGALKKNGLEAYFTTVLSAKKVTIKDIEKEAEEGKLLTISDRDRSLGYKHVLQTRTIKATVGDRIRTPFGLFADEETYIENDVQLVIDRLTAYYAD